MQFNRPISLYKRIKCLSTVRKEQQILPGLKSAQSYATSHAPEEIHEINNYSLQIKKKREERRNYDRIEMAKLSE